MNIQPTHYIVSMTMGLTKSNTSMWRCLCTDGTRVNVFDHPDPKKDSFGFFARAGYAIYLESLVNGQELTWKECPIPVILTKNGDWWNIAGVLARPEDAHPDPVYEPQHDLYRHRSAEWARMITPAFKGVRDIDTALNSLIRFWDTETTGLTKEDEIVSISIIAPTGDVVFSSLVKPLHPERLLITNADGICAADVTGIRPEMLESAPTFPDLYGQLLQALAGRVWVIWNAPFDTTMLEQDCIRHNLPPICSLGISDAMQMYAAYHGEWNPVHQHYMSKTLVFACEQFGIDIDQAHDSLADSRMMLAVCQKMARVVVHVD